MIKLTNKSLLQSMQLLTSVMGCMLDEAHDRQNVAEVTYKLVCSIIQGQPILHTINTACLITFVTVIITSMYAHTYVHMYIHGAFCEGERNNMQPYNVQHFCSVQMTRCCHCHCCHCQKAHAHNLTTKNNVSSTEGRIV